MPMFDRPSLSALLTLLIILGVQPGLTGCGDKGTGPTAVKWDRIACERCRMVLSARNYAAQVRLFDAKGVSTPHYFDDLGCAVIWLDNQPSPQDPRTEIWVNDWRNGTWLDARRAYYLKGKETPMQYGLGAQAEFAPGALDFAAAKSHILAVEARYNAPVFNPQAASEHGHSHLTQ